MYATQQLIQRISSHFGARFILIKVILLLKIDNDPIQIMNSLKKNNEVISVIFGTLMSDIIGENTIKPNIMGELIKTISHNILSLCFRILRFIYRKQQFR